MDKQHEKELQGLEDGENTPQFTRSNTKKKDQTGKYQAMMVSIDTI